MNRGVSTIEAQVTQASNGCRLDRALTDAIPDMSRERVKALIGAGQVADVHGTLFTDPSKKVMAGSIFFVTVPAPIPLDNEAQDIALTVVYEDDELIVIDKPAGLVVHPAAGNLDGTLVNALLHHCAGNLSGIGGVVRPGIVHRIDKDTSGLLVAAKTDRAHEGLAVQFRDHSIERRYKAIVTGHPMPMSGSVDAPLSRSSSNRKKMAIVPGGKRAITHFRTITLLRDAALVECRLETGRTHQVRVHMTSIGHPLLGDPVYGRTKQGQKQVLETLNFRRQALHAAVLGFIHPVNSLALSFESEMPADMQELFSSLHV